MDYFNIGNVRLINREYRFYIDVCVYYVDGRGFTVVGVYVFFLEMGRWRAYKYYKMITFRGVIGYEGITF